MQQALKSFGRRYLCQLQVLPGRALLLSLGEEGVNAHRLPHFKVTAQAARTRFYCCVTLNLTLTLTPHSYPPAFNSAIRSEIGSQTRSQVSSMQNDFTYCHTQQQAAVSWCNTGSPL